MKENKVKLKEIIFKELIKRGYSINKKNRVWNVSDSKLWYLTEEQAREMIELENSKNYADENKKEKMFLAENIEEIKKEIGCEGINFIDIGCEGGEEAFSILEKLDSNSPFRYCPIDLNQYLVKKASNNFVRKFPKGKLFIPHQNSDLDDIVKNIESLKVGRYKKNVIFISTNLFTNLEANEILYLLRINMNVEDLLILSSPIQEKHWIKRAKRYTTGSLTDKMAFHVLSYLGIKRDDVKFGSRFINNRTELFYTFKKDVKLKQDDREIVFNKGDEIVVVVAYKHKKEDLLTYLHMNFKYVTTSTSKDKLYILALCKK
jgi:uncharacterized SAM-dependent methyltransferase